MELNLELCLNRTFNFSRFFRFFEIFRDFFMIFRDFSRFFQPSFSVANALVYQYIAIVGYGCPVAVEEFDTQ